MKAINYRVSLNGQARIATALVPANHTEAVGVNKWGLAVAGALLVLTLSFFSLLVLVLTK
jgi:uncharacterized membrane protein